MSRSPSKEYAEHVTSGGRVGCRWEVLACQRHLDDLKAGAFFFDEKAEAAAIKIFSSLKHYKGKLAGKEFKLHPSQKFIIGSIYGWKLKKDGPRRFTSAYIEIPRKNGKTTLSAGVGVLGILEERGAEVYSVATKE
jgi:phage terminase large subunit-like protein